MIRKLSEIGHIGTEAKWSGVVQEAPGCRKRNRIGSGPARKRKNGSRAEQHISRRNYIWSCHIIKTPAIDGRLIRIFAVTDEHSQECLLALSDNCISSETVTDELFALFLQRGIPKYLVTFDNSELLPEALCEWIKDLDLNGTFVEVKKHNESGSGPLFIRKFMKALFEEKEFASLADAKLWLANWKNEYNRSISFLRI